MKCLLADVLKVNDLRKKIQTNVVHFDDISEENGNYDEINASVPVTSDISPIVRTIKLSVEV